MHCKDVKLCVMCKIKKPFNDFSSNVNRMCNLCHTNEELRKREEEKKKVEGKNNSGSNICNKCNCSKNVKSPNNQISCKCDKKCYICSNPLGSEGKLFECSHWVCKNCILPSKNMPNSPKTIDKECVKCKKVYFCRAHKMYFGYQDHMDYKYIDCCKTTYCLKCYKAKKQNHICSFDSQAI